MVKDISKFIIDGEEYSISEDRKQYIGPKKKFTAEDFRKEKGGKIQVIYVPREAAEDGTAFGFSDEEKLEKWLKDTNRFDEYQKMKELEKKLKRKRTPEEDEEIKQYQMKEVKRANQKYKKFLERHNLKPGELKKRREILEDHDPHFKFKSHSLYLFDGVMYMPPWVFVVLPGGHSYCGIRYSRAYPNLGYCKDIFGKGFDNRASSLIIDCASYGKLFTDINYGGAWMYFATHVPTLDFATHSFNNSFSSAIVY